VYKRLEPQADISRDEFYETGQYRLLTMEDMTVLVSDDDRSFDSGYNRLGSGGDTVIVTGLRVLEADAATTAATTNKTVSDHEDYVYFYARECNCFEQWAPVVFCPFAIDTCLRGSWGTPPGCRNVNKAQSFAWTVQILSLAGFVILLFFCCEQEGTGANSRDFLLSLCFPRYRERLADRIIQRNPQRALRLYRSIFLDQQAEMLQGRQWIISVVSGATVLRQQVDNQRQEREVELPEIENRHVSAGDEANNRRTLLLRTAVYRQPSLDDSYHGNVCAICFVDLVDGDRIGVLEVCRHQFHVECLKPWLQRRNMCPLCQKVGIAKPHNEKLTSSEITMLHSIGSSVDESPSEEGERQVR
jgi:hypothetical protein